MIYRIDVWPRTPAASPVTPAAAALGVDVGDTRESRVFWVETDASAADVNAAADRVLADPITDAFALVSAPHDDAGRTRIEVFPKPGVMDPVAASAATALRDAGLPVRAVGTGRAYAFGRTLSDADRQRVADRLLANGVVDRVAFATHLPTQFAAATPKAFDSRSVALRDLDAAALATLSRRGHLFLSPAEMAAVQAYYRAAGRDPTDIELETVAQTWSEHCVHKTLKSAVTVVDEHGTTLRAYGNLIKETIFASTQELIRRRADGFCLSVFQG